MSAVEQQQEAEQQQEVPGLEPVLQEEEEEALTYTEIEELQQHGIGMGEINKLKADGIYTVKTLQQSTEKRLLAIKGFSSAKVEKCMAAADKMEQTTFQTAAIELQRREKHVFKIDTGVQELNKMLGGGFDSQAMTELHGEWRTGKTQICHTLCITTQIPKEGTTYGGGRIVYIDTEGTFRPERLEPICERYGIDYSSALENIYHVRALNTDHMMRTLTQMSSLLIDNQGTVKLLIIDSIMALFRTDYTGRGELAGRQQKLGQVLRLAHRMAEEFNFAVVMTNQMTSDPGGGMTFVSDPKKPIGGHVLAHAVQTRVALRKGQGEDRVAKLVDSPTLPLSEASFTITNGGIADTN